MLLAEELALVSIDPGSGRHALGIRDQLNACLAGLLVAQLVLDGAAAPGEAKGTVALTGRAGPMSALLAAAAAVVAEKGPKVKAILSHMSRGLGDKVGAGTWDAVTASLVAAGAIAPSDGGLRPRHDVTDAAARDAIVERLRIAAAGNEPIEALTAVLLSMTGPANLLQLVAPERSTRRHARKRIDHALDGSSLEPIGELVRRVIAEAAAAASVAAFAATS